MAGHVHVARPIGPGLSEMTLADRATIANMAPEYGATCGFLPVDDLTVRYLRTTGRTTAEVELVARPACPRKRPRGPC